MICLTQTTPQRALSPQSCRRCRRRSSPSCWQTTALLAPCLPSCGAVEKPMAVEKTPQQTQSTSEGPIIISSTWYRSGQLRVAFFLLFECLRRTPQGLLPNFAGQESVSKCGPQPHRKTAIPTFDFWFSRETLPYSQVYPWIPVRLSELDQTSRQAVSTTTKCKR